MTIQEKLLLTMKLDHEQKTTDSLRCEVKKLLDRISVMEASDNLLLDNEILQKENITLKREIETLKRNERCGNTYSHKVSISKNKESTVSSDGLMRVSSNSTRWVLPEEIVINLDGREIKLTDIWGKRVLVEFLKRVHDSFGSPTVARDEKRVIRVCSKTAPHKIRSVLLSFNKIDGNYCDLEHPTIGKKRFPKFIYSYITSKTL